MNYPYNSIILADYKSRRETTSLRSVSLVGCYFYLLLFNEEKNEPTYKVKSVAVERMLIGLYTGDYTKISPSEVISQLPCSSEQQAILSKKLKEANFETNVKNLREIGGFSEQDASDYAYCATRS